MRRETYKYIVYYSYLNGWKGFHNETEMYQHIMSEDADIRQVTIFRPTAHGSIEACVLRPYYKLTPIEVKD